VPRIPRLAIVVGTLAGVIVLTMAAAGVHLLAHGGTGATAAAGAAGTAPGPAHSAGPRADLPLVTVPGQDTGAAAAPTPSAIARPSPDASAGAGLRLTPPAVVAIAPRRVGDAHLRRLRSLRHVRGALTVGGGAVRVAGVTLNLLAVPVAEFPRWTPVGVADRPEPWEALRRGELVAEAAAARRLGLVPGAHYQIDGGPRLRLAAAAAIGLPGIDGYVSEETGRRLGLTPGVVVLVSGPVTRAGELTGGVRRVLGAGTQVVVTGAPAAARTAAPRAARTPSRDEFTGRVGRPGSYIELYRRAAALCPGLSWTVLAAIGQVESGHGRDNGPSSAGALGPMQFMPATWKAYGVDGDGDGRADIMNPYDAVPAAANYLCATGAGQGGDRLAKAIWHYNHSWSYVSKVLSLANAYAAAYPD